MRYSLANYILSIEPNDARIRSIFGTFSIGGEGSTVGSVSFNRSTDTFSTQGFSTGGWVHNKNLSRVGTVSLQLSQLSDAVAKFIKLADTFLGGDYEGFTLTLTSNDGVKVATAVDAYIVKVPAQEFTESASNQTWDFTAGQINFGS